MKHRYLLLLVVLAVVSLVPPPGLEFRAESRIGSDTSITTEEPDPLGLDTLFGESDKFLEIDPGSATVDVGDPHVVVDPRTGRPLVTWATYVGPDHDIAFAEMLADGWGPIRFLSSTLDEDSDPKLFLAPDGTLYVTWWQHDPRQPVLLATRRPGDAVWSYPFEVTAPGRRPSVAVAEGRVWIAFARDAADGGQQVVARAESPGAEPREFVLATTARTEPLDIMVHAESGKLWVDWKHSVNEFGYLEWVDGSWQDAPRTFPWVDLTDEGENQVRRAIAKEVLEPDF